LARAQEVQLKAIVLAQPRGFCAGVVRAIEVVETVLGTHGPPVYVLHEIVHNQRVVTDLRARGAVFVERLTDIPPGALTIFSAHGVPESVVRAAHDRQLEVIDATCPLVAKVHAEVARHARAGRDVVMVGHAGHAEVIGTMGRYDRSAGGEVHLVQTVADAMRLEVRDPGRLAVVTQTTLSVDDTRRILETLRRRFPGIVESRKDDICYATQNRQNAVRQLAGNVDLLLVVGARNSSNSNRLREVGEQAGVAAHLVQDAAEVDLAWLRPGQRVGVTAGASTPEVLVQEVLEKLARLGAASVTEMDGPLETTTFRLPTALAAMQRPPEQHEQWTMEATAQPRSASK